jgi:knotted carbamoyltransferase YgeW
MMTKIDEVREKVDRLAKLSPELEGRDFLATWDHGDDTLRFVLYASEILEDLVRMGMGTRAFDRGLAMSMFRGGSTHARYAFESGCNLVGLGTGAVDDAPPGLPHSETVRDAAAMTGFLTDVFGIGDDVFLGEGHLYMTEVAASLAEAHRAGALFGRPTVVNLASDIDQPAQSLADLRHLARVFGGLAGVRSRKIAVSWAYSPKAGKSLAVPQGTVALLARFGAHVWLAHPPGYELATEPLAKARAFAEESGGSVRIVDSMSEAFDGADAVYPKSWAPISILEERTRLLRTRRLDHLKDLDAQELAASATHVGWTCNEARMHRTQGGNALYMHDLPADVTGLSCERGEVDRSVMERARLDTYKQASHKPFVIAAMILGMRLADPTASLGRMLDAGASMLAAHKRRPPTVPPASSSRRY